MTAVRKLGALAAAGHVFGGLAHQHVRLGAAKHEHGATDLIPQGPEDDVLDGLLLQRQANGGIVIGRDLAIGPAPFVKCLLS